MIFPFNRNIASPKKYIIYLFFFLASSTCFICTTCASTCIISFLFLIFLGFSLLLMELINILQYKYTFPPHLCILKKYQVCHLDQIYHFTFLLEQVLRWVLAADFVFCFAGQYSHLYSFTMPQASSCCCLLYSLSKVRLQSGFRHASSLIPANKWRAMWHAYPFYFLSTKFWSSSILYLEIYIISSCKKKNNS